MYIILLLATCSLCIASATLDALIATTTPIATLRPRQQQETAIGYFNPTVLENGETTCK
jgi:hypothetical protein